MLIHAVASLLALAPSIGLPEQAHVTVAIPASSTSTSESTVTLAAPPNAIVSARIVLSNRGAEGTPFHWEASTSLAPCFAAKPSGWLAIEPAFGSVEGGHSSDIAIYASSFAAATGVRRGFLCIRSREGVQPLIEVPVVLTVGGSDVSVP